MSTSPMMLQWQRCKEKAPGALLLFRLGDFYEAFHDDAVSLSEAVNVTLTKRQDVPMSGIPFHTCEGYIDKLVAKGFRVAIAEQIEDLQAVKGLVSRDVVRIVTRGSLINSSLLVEKSNNFIAAVDQVNATYAIALLDLTTADFRTLEVESKAELLDALSRLRPSELICSQKADRALKLPNALVREDWLFDHESSVETLKKQFHLQSLSPLGLQGKVAEVNAAGALISYLQDELQLSLAHVVELHPEELSGYMLIDQATERQLELVESLHDGKTLLEVLDKTKTPMGGRLLKQWLLHPLLSIEAIRARQDAVEELLKDQELPSILQAVRDLERLMMRIETGYASPKDLLPLRLSLEAAARVRTELEGSKTALLQQERDAISDFSSLCQELSIALAADLPLRTNEGGIFQNGYNQELDALRAFRLESHDWIASYQTSLKEESGIRTLKIGYTRGFGYYIEISRGQADRAPSYFERKQTLTNAERFITQELKEYEYRLATTEEKIIALELELFGKLRERLIQNSARIRKSAQAIGVIDTLVALATLAKMHNYVRPLVDTSDQLHIEEGRHPVIEQALGSSTFISNDLDLDAEQRLLLITGPNMAGKSTFIRQVGLICLMAQVGSFVPAKSAHLGVIDKLFSRIGASDNLAKGQSTFMVEMTETANILRNATEKSLVILDEIGRGTSTYDGISIAWAVAEYLLKEPKKRAKTLFATHYGELTALESQVPGACNFHVSVLETPDGIIFLHKIARGSTDRSYGIHVAQLAGLPYPVLKRAQEMLRTLERTQKT